VVRGEVDRKFTILCANSRWRLSLAYDSREIGPRGEPGSFSPRPASDSFLLLLSFLAPCPFPCGGNAYRLNYGARDTVKFCGADKGAIQIKRSPFPSPAVLAFFYPAPLPALSLLPPSRPVRLFSPLSSRIPLDASLIPLLVYFASTSLIPLLVYFAPLSEAAAFPLGCSTSSSRLDDSFPYLSYVSYKDSRRKRGPRDEKRGIITERTGQFPFRFHLLSLATPRTLVILLGVDCEIPARGNYPPQILASKAGRRSRSVQTDDYGSANGKCRR
jgi:hypothetical protein